MEDVLIISEAREGFLKEGQSRITLDRRGRGSSNRQSRAAGTEGCTLEAWGI